MRSLLRIAKIVLALVLSFTFTLSLWKLIIFANDKYFNEWDAVGSWLEENDLGQYRDLFRDLGEFRVYLTTFTCPSTSLTRISIKRSFDSRESFRFCCCFDG